MKHIITKHLLNDLQPATVLWFEHQIGKRAVVYLELFDSQNTPLMAKTRFEFKSKSPVKQFSATLDGLYLPYSYKLTFVSLIKNTVCTGLCDGEYEDLIAPEMDIINKAVMLS